PISTFAQAIAQFRRPARLRDRLREGRPLGQPIKVRLTYQAVFRRAPKEGASRWPVARAHCRRCCGPATRYRHQREMRGASNQLHTCRPGTARAMPVPWVMSNAAFWSLWCFVFVLPWDKFILMPVLGSIPRLVGLAASAVGVVPVLARRRAW